MQQSLKRSQIFSSLEIQESSLQSNYTSLLLETCYWHSLRFVLALSNAVHYTACSVVKMPLELQNKIASMYFTKF